MRENTLFAEFLDTAGELGGSEQLYPTKLPIICADTCPQVELCRITTKYMLTVPKRPLQQRMTKIKTRDIESLFRLEHQK